ncbi:MAG: type II secretion system protein M [Pseudomonadales bacterium]|nr:type II secretion system protein M [Pseudomonadales bacterium]
MSESNALGALNDKLRDVKRNFYGLQAREQNLIIALGVVVIIALIYLLLMFPAQRAVSDASKRLESKQSLLQWMKANEDAAKAISSSPRGRQAGGNQDLLGAVNNIASRNKITLQRYEPEGKDKLRVWLENTSFNSVVRWLHQLEVRNGITVASISLDAEKEAGLVSAKIVLRK